MTEKQLKKELFKANAAYFLREALILIATLLMMIAGFFVVLYLAILFIAVIIFSGGHIPI